MSVRPTKKQQELLNYIERFVAEHGYGPSYREIMNGCNYSSVATVAVHINNLITRGHLTKRDHSARSIEVVKQTSGSISTPQVKFTANNEKWLIDIIETKFQAVENSAKIQQKDIDKLYMLVAALSVLEFDGAAVAFKTRIRVLEA
jgi:SOS-response transcriptional repressor LexA